MRTVRIKAQDKRDAQRSSAMIPRQFIGFHFKSWRLRSPNLGSPNLEIVTYESFMASLSFSNEASTKSHGHDSACVCASKYYF